MTAQEFVAWELDRPGRHEYFRGEVIKVLGEEGAQGEYITVMGNIGAALDEHLRGTTSQTFIAQMRILVAATGDMFYPDVLVTCDLRDVASLEMQHPKLIIEVLSPSLDRCPSKKSALEICSQQATIDPCTAS